MRRVGMLLLAVSMTLGCGGATTGSDGGSGATTGSDESPGTPPDGEQPGSGEEPTTGPNGGSSDDPLQDPGGSMTGGNTDPTTDNPPVNDPAMDDPAADDLLGEIVPASPAAVAIYESIGCDVPTVTKLADGPGFVGRILGWQESTGRVPFDENGARVDVGLGAWYSIASVPEKSLYYYGETGALEVGGPFELSGLGALAAPFTDESLSVVAPSIAVYRDLAEGHLLAVRLDSFEYGGPSTCQTGVLGQFTYWLIPYGEGSFADFTIY